MRDLWKEITKHMGVAKSCTHFLFVEKSRFYERFSIEKSHFYEGAEKSLEKVSICVEKSL